MNEFLARLSKILKTLQIINIICTIISQLDVFFVFVFFYSNIFCKKRNKLIISEISTHNQHISRRRYGVSILYVSCPIATLKVLLKLTFQAERASNLNGRQNFVNFRETNLEL